MKYQQPFGVLDPDASYEDGNRVTGTKGSIPPAKAIEAPQREIVHVISYFGLTPDALDDQQLRKAIEAGIAAATGGGDTSDYVLMTQARARLPIFPEIQTADGRMIVSSPGAGTILVPPAVAFQHRGIYPASTSDYPEIDRTFATVANKTYHLRWAYGAGFSLEDVADAGGYNPTALPEVDAAFDSTYDDMLIARVVTNGSNVATITNLANKDRLAVSVNVQGQSPAGAGGTSDFATVDISHSLNWARRPSTSDAYLAKSFFNGVGVDFDFNVAPEGTAKNNSAMIAAAPGLTVDRYHVGAVVLNDVATETWLRISARA